MTVLIVAESCFGNTLTVANAIATGLSGPLGPGVVTVVRPSEAPHELPAGVDLPLVGAPTHQFSMPTQNSQKQATTKGATGSERVGIREWLERVVPQADLRVVTFDTSVRMKFTPGSASKAAFKACRKRGFRHAERGPSFYVSDTAGPLAAGEEERAPAWGVELGGPPRRPQV